MRLFILRFPCPSSKCVGGDKKNTGGSEQHDPQYERSGGCKENAKGGKVTLVLVFPVLPVSRYLEHFALVTFNIWLFIPTLHMLV